MHKGGLSPLSSPTALPPSPPYTHFCPGLHPYPICFRSLQYHRDQPVPSYLIDHSLTVHQSSYDQMPYGAFYTTKKILQICSANDKFQQVLVSVSWGNSCSVKQAGRGEECPFTTGQLSWESRESPVSITVHKEAEKRALKSSMPTSLEGVLPDADG